MKLFLAILFLSSTLQCGKLNKDLISIKRDKYWLQMCRFDLQISLKEILLHDFEASSRLLAEVESITPEIGQDIVFYTNSNVNVKKFKLYLKKLKLYACLLRLHMVCLREVESNSDFDNE